LFGLSLTVLADQQTVGAKMSAEEPGGAPEGEPDSDEVEEGVPEIEVEVVGKREGLLSISPAPGEAMTEVNVQDIEDSGARFVIDAIDMTPSVFVRHQGARYENRLSIRGAAPRLVLLDGIPIAREGYTGLGGGAGGKEAGFAGRILYTLPVEIIERIDVIRSVGTLVYGPTAATGAVINIVTKEPEVGSEHEASASAGSYGQQRAHVLAGVSDGRLAYLVEGGMDYADSHLELGQKRFNNAFAKIVYNEPDGSKLLIDYFGLDGRRTLDLSEDFTIVPPRYWQIDPWKEDFANVVYSKALKGDSTLDFAVYQRDRSFLTTQFTNDSFATTRQTWDESQDDQGIDLRYSHRTDAGRLTRAGLQWSKINSDTLQTVYIGPSGPLPTPRVTAVEQERTTRSLFYQTTVPLRPDFRLSLGGRYDDPDDYDGAFTWSLGFDSDLSPQQSWHLHLGTGTEHPLPTDGDIDRGIAPEEANTVAAETGTTRRLDSRSSASFNVFYSRTENARILYNDPPGEIGPLAYVSKAEDLTQWGAEIVYDREISKDARWFVNYTYLREDVTNENDPPIPGPDYPTLPEPPRHLLAAGYRANVNETRVSLNAKYSDDYMALNRIMKTAAPVDSYLVFDLRLTRPLGTGEVSLFIDNLLDTEYETMPAFSRPGRNFLLTGKIFF
jgi:outer membrane cobalamin receptor